MNNNNFFKNKPRLGISSACFFPRDTLESLRDCISLGFKSAELFINTHSELSGEYLYSLRDEARAADVKITSIHPFTSGYEYILFFTNYSKRAVDSTDYYENYLRAASELGAEYLVFHGDNLRAPFIGYERYAEVYDALAQRARSFGVTLLHENVSTSHMGIPEYISKLRSYLPDIKYTFDIKQACRAGFSPMEVLEAMGAENVRHVHLNDWANNCCCLPCTGDVDVAQVIRTLLGAGYDGAYIFEVYRENFSSLSDIAESKILTEELFARL